MANPSTSTSRSRSTSCSDERALRCAKGSLDTAVRNPADDIAIACPVRAGQALIRQRRRLRGDRRAARFARAAARLSFAARRTRWIQGFVPGSPRSGNYGIRINCATSARSSSASAPPSPRLRRASAGQDWIEHQTSDLRVARALACAAIHLRQGFGGSPVDHRHKQGRRRLLSNPP